jgi:hypothetical protein
VDSINSQTLEQNILTFFDNNSDKKKGPPVLQQTQPLLVRNLTEEPER